MPISQERMVALIASAQDFKRAWESLCEAIASARTSAAEGSTSAETSLDMLYYSAPHTLSEPAKSTSTILLEAKHFKDHWRENVRSRERLQRQRGSLGLGGTSPRTLEPSPQLPTSVYELANMAPGQSIEELMAPRRAPGPGLTEARKRELEAIARQIDEDLGSGMFDPTAEDH